MNTTATLPTAIRRLPAIVLLAATAGAVYAGTPDVELELFASPIDRPSVITNAGDNSDRVFIAELTGAIRIVDANGTLLPAPFLDLDPQSACCSEQGVLGLAFHPDYETNGYFYVHYSDLNGDTVVSRFSVSAGDPNVADLGSELQLLTLAQPVWNHNGGQIEFGPDGYLYIGLGDGGGSGDTADRAQNMGLLFGKILRIDVDNQDPPLEYAIPDDNPFVGEPGAREEIWALGLRNPWRFSFDRLTGDLFIGDVGQNLWEEVDLQPASSTGGENWGWRCYEGNATFNTTGCGPAGDYDFPILVYPHSSDNCSINGGYVYRGSDFPNLWGTYLYGDYCTGRIWGASFDGMSWSSVELEQMTTNQSTFGQDEDGELYVGAFVSTTGAVYRIVDANATHLIFADGFESGDTGAWTDVAP
jgi:glucose/arabinose dehydrogenase